MGPFSPQFQSMTLEKGAMIFHMLRGIVGDKAFLNILKGALSQYAGGPIRASDFEKVAEEQSQQQLLPFFAQWIDGTGAPSFTDKYAVYRLGNGKGFRTIGEIDQDLDLFRMPVELRVETDGKTVTQKIDVVGTNSQYVVDTFGRPRRISIDPQDWVLKTTPDLQVRISILKGQQLVAQGDLVNALAEYQKALTANPQSSLASYRIGEVLFTQRNYQASVNAFRDALRGDDEPAWTEVWSHIAIGKIFDVTGQRDRAVNEYRLAVQTNDNTQGAVNEARLYLQKPYTRPRTNEMGCKKRRPAAQAGLHFSESCGLFVTFRTPQRKHFQIHLRQARVRHGQLLRRAIGEVDHPAFLPQVAAVGNLHHHRALVGPVHHLHH
jgi:hypothetical protein